MRKALARAAARAGGAVGPVLQLIIQDLTPLFLSFIYSSLTLIFSLCWHSVCQNQHIISILKLDHEGVDVITCLINLIFP